MMQPTNTMSRVLKIVSVFIMTVTFCSVSIAGKKSKQSEIQKLAYKLNIANLNRFARKALKPTTLKEIHAKMSPLYYQADREFLDSMVKKAADTTILAKFNGKNRVRLFIGGTMATIEVNKRGFLVVNGKVLHDDQNLGIKEYFNSVGKTIYQQQSSHSFSSKLMELLIEKAFAAEKTEVKITLTYAVTAIARLKEERKVKTALNDMALEEECREQAAYVLSCRNTLASWDGKSVNAKMVQSARKRSNSDAVTDSKSRTCAVMLLEAGMLTTDPAKANDLAYGEDPSTENIDDIDPKSYEFESKVEEALANHLRPAVKECGESYASIEKAAEKDSKKRALVSVTLQDRTPAAEAR